MLARLLEYLPFALPFYLVRFKIGPLPTTLLEVYLGVIFVVFLYERGLEGVRKGWNSLGQFRWPIIAWIAATLMAVFISPSLRTGLGLWRAYVLEPILIFLILSHVLPLTKGESKRVGAALTGVPSEGSTSPNPSLVRRGILSRNLFLVTVALTIWALFQFITGYGIPHPWNVAIDAGRRATGPFPYPNALALFVVPIAAYALSFVGVDGVHPAPSLERRGRAQALRPYAWAALAASFLSLFLAKSDGGLIALAAVTWLALIFQKRLRLWVLAATALGLLLVALVPAIHKPLIHELTFQGWSGKVRMYMWRDSYAMLKDHWFFGAGFGGYPTVFKPYQRTTGIEVFQYPHNILLNFWSETGLLGSLAFAWILLTAFRLVLRDTCHVIRFLPFLVILIHGLVDAPYFKNDLALLFWILVWLTTQSSILSNPSSKTHAS